MLRPRRRRGPYRFCVLRYSDSMTSARAPSATDLGALALPFRAVAIGDAFPLGDHPVEHPACTVWMYYALDLHIDQFDSVVGHHARGAVEDQAGDLVTSQLERRAASSSITSSTSSVRSKARLPVRTTSIRLWLAMTLRVSPSMMSSRRDWAPARRAGAGRTAAGWRCASARRSRPRCTSLSRVGSWFAVAPFEPVEHVRFLGERQLHVQAGRGDGRADRLTELRDDDLARPRDRVQRRGQRDQHQHHRGAGQQPTPQGHGFTSGAAAGVEQGEDVFTTSKISFLPASGSHGR